MGRMESDLRVKEYPEYEKIRRITKDDEEGVVTARLPRNFSGKEEDAMRWIRFMKAYFIINSDTYGEKAQTLVMLNKMSMGRRATFTEGWYLKLANNNIPLEQKTFAKLDKDFH